jgi:thiol-disulfide isomerase/thioredoxin
LVKKIVLIPPDIHPIEKTINLNWEVKTLDGETINLKKQFQGKPVFLNFWATWCPPCIAEMPSIERLYGRYNSTIAFACVSNESIDDLRKYKDAKGYTVPIYHITGDSPSSLSVKGIPMTFIISGNRKLSFRHYGGADWAHKNVVEYFKGLLNKDQE